MNILLVNHYANVPKMAGGTRHFSFAKELLRRGHNVTIVASSFNHKSRRETRQWHGERYQTELVEGVRFVWVKTPPYSGNTLARIRNMMGFAYSLSRLPEAAFGPAPDVVYGSSPHLFATWAAQRLATKWQVPFVLEIRDLWPESLVALGNISRLHPFILLLEYIERYLYRRADRIITLLPGAGEHMQQKGADPGKITWIPNGVDLQTSNGLAPPTKKDNFIATFAGTHGLANQLDLVLDAAAQLRRDERTKNVTLHLIGDGPDKPRLMNRAKEMGLRNVIFDEPVPKTEIYDVLAEADCFLLTLQDSPLFKWGISPNKLFDYMAAARPVILTLDAPYGHSNSEQTGVFNCAGNGSSLAEAITILMEMGHEQRWELGRQARRYVEKHHSMSALVDRLEAVFEGAVGERFDG